MRRSSLVAFVVLVAGLALILPTFTPPAAADHRWDAVGSLFRIGGLSFAIALGQPFLSAPRGYYYRTADPFDYRGVRCSSACFRDRDYGYHHEGCPVVRHHFAVHRVDLDHLHSRYAPGWHDRHGYRDRYDDDRHDRYDDRHGRYDRDRYDKRDRGGYRGHGQYRGKGHYRDGRGHGKGHRHHDHDRDRCPYDHDHRRH